MTAGAGIVAQQMKHHLQHRYLLEAPVKPRQLHFQLLVNVLEEVAEDGPSAWTPQLTCEIQMQSQAHDFGLALSRLSVLFGE